MKLFDAGLNGFQLVVHLKTCIDSVECVEAVVKVLAVMTLAFGIEVVNIRNGVVEIRYRLTEEFQTLGVQLFIKPSFVGRRYVVGFGEFVDGAVVEHLTHTEVGYELIGQRFE